MIFRGVERNARYNIASRRLHNLLRRAHFALERPGIVIELHRCLCYSVCVQYNTYRFCLLSLIEDTGARFSLNQNRD